VFPYSGGRVRDDTEPFTSDPCAAYAARLRALGVEQRRRERRYIRIARWRRFLLAALVVLVLLVERERVVTKIVLIAVPAFLMEQLIKRHERVARSMRKNQWLEEHFERRLACVEDRWAATGNPGTRYLDPDHPAAGDLDLFGVGCLFERLAAPCTRAGEDTLAAWLLASADADNVRERQSAVTELRERFELREELARLADHVAESGELRRLADWGGAAPGLDASATRALGAATVVLTIFALISGLFLGAGLIPLLVALGFQAGFSVALRRRAGEVLRPFDERTYDLPTLGRLIARLEQESFKSPRLTRLHAEFISGPASRRLARLDFLQRCVPFAALFRLRPQMAVWLDRWHRSFGPALGRWLAALGEIEALCALAAYSFECPGDPFPEIADDGAVFEAAGLGHPLLPRGRCVRNDLALGDGLRVLVVSGSNMAGKSTLLRAVGVNAVLALAGAPVRATRLRLAPLAIGATLRIQDSLQKGRSRFQAEVFRVRRMLEMACDKPPLLFLLDELFQGTNSADRLAGAEALVRQLVDAGAIGLVTTHDLALTEIADRLAGRAANVHFEDQFSNGELIFDYRMKPGVVRHTNGLALMRAVGIEV
jgi:hypothetical protein